MALLKALQSFSREAWVLTRIDEYLLFKIKENKVVRATCDEMGSMFSEQRSGRQSQTAAQTCTFLWHWQPLQVFFSALTSIPPPLPPACNRRASSGFGFCTAFISSGVSGLRLSLSASNNNCNSLWTLHCFSTMQPISASQRCVSFVICSNGQSCYACIHTYIVVILIKMQITSGYSKIYLHATWCRKTHLRDMTS